MCMVTGAARSQHVSYQQCTFVACCPTGHATAVPAIASNEKPHANQWTRLHMLLRGHMLRVRCWMHRYLAERMGAWPVVRGSRARVRWHWERVSWPVVRNAAGPPQLAAPFPEQLQAVCR